MHCKYTGGIYRPCCGHIILELGQMLKFEFENLLQIFGEHLNIRQTFEYSATSVFWPM